MKLVIQTQYRENYAAHNDGYQHGVDEAYWKMKGGATYIVCDLTQAHMNRIVDNGIPMLSALIEDRNEAFEEYIIDWEIVEDNATVCEDWETPTQFTFTDGVWSCTRFTDGAMQHWREGILAKKEAWTPLEGGERTGYSCFYKTASGWHEQNSHKLKVELAA
jgi:hypothetical protein